MVYAYDSFVYYLALQAYKLPSKHAAVNNVLQSNATSSTEKVEAWAMDNDAQVS